MDDASFPVEPKPIGRAGMQAQQKRRERERLHGQRGQSLAETAIGLAVVTLLMLGIVEFGRAFMISNAITNAARVGARAVAMEPATNRNSSGILLSSTNIVDSVKEEIANTVGQPVANAVTVSVSQVSGITNVPRARVTVAGQIPYMFNLVGTSFNLSRTVTYRDQGR
jgi:Flp pilus assembly protein TadG